MSEGFRCFRRESRHVVLFAGVAFPFPSEEGRVAECATKPGFFLC
jgi:hypothetical protein